MLETISSNPLVNHFVRNDHFDDRPQNSGEVRWRPAGKLRGQRKHMNDSDDKREARERHISLLTKIARDRSRPAFQELYQHFAPRVRAFLQGGGSDPHAAEEIAQEAMINVWRKAHLFDPTKAAVSTWIFTIARNARIDHLRRTNRPEPDVNDPAFKPEPQALPHELLSREEEAVRLRTVISTLPDEQQKVLKLAFFEEMSHAEVASQLDIPLGTVKSRIRLALGRIRSVLGDDA